MNEPKAVNDLADRAEALRKETLDCFSKQPPPVIHSLFSEMSFFLYEQVAYEWLAAGKYDALIDYIVYEHEHEGGDDLWMQLLLELRQKNDRERIEKLCNGLYDGREEIFREKIKLLKKNPENHFCQAAAAKAKGEVMKVLYEHAFFLENKPKSEQDYDAISKIRKKIKCNINADKLT